MPLLVGGTVIYLLVGTIAAALLYDDPAQVIGDIIQAVPGSLSFFMSIGWWVVPVFAAVAMVAPGRALRDRLPRAIVAVFLCSTFFLVFTMLKTSFPMIMPFWADPLFARIDQAIHFGFDPWEIVHRIGIPGSPEAAARVYFAAWLVPAVYLPVLLFLFDDDQKRIGRFVLLFFFAWVVVGNAFAVSFLSAGPVYFDRLLGGDRFAGLLDALDASGVSASSVGSTQARLWVAYASGSADLGSGISAFPSVHVAMVTVISLYLAERRRWLALPGAVLVGVFVYLSVYFGWHYAVDGYVSVLLVLAAWTLLYRRSAAM